jgi:ATP-dependent DNA helicase RecG
VIENQLVDKKSLRHAHGNTRDFHGLARDCVAFANAGGGRILIGIERDADDPPPDQRIPSDLPEALVKRISQLTMNVVLMAEKVTAANGGEYVECAVPRSPRAIACCSDGRYYIRVSDQTRPLLPDQLGRLMVEKAAYVWEADTSAGVARGRCEASKAAAFLEGIRQSDRVSPFIKSQSNDEILDRYMLADGPFLTNLGVLWIGTGRDRSRLLYAPSIQFIKYDSEGRKVRKRVWDDFALNPQEMIDAVWRDIDEWREGVDLPEGMYRRVVPDYDEVILRECVTNALAHRPYTMRGDIFLNLHPDRLEVHSPGLLPLGVTPANILHTTVRRNEHLAKVLYDLGLMEREGSGYDRMYEVLLVSGRPPPEVVEGEDRVVVTIQKGVVDSAVVDFIHKADAAYALRQRERICLGLLAQHEALSVEALVRRLELRDARALRDWIGRLGQFNLISTRGRTRGLEYSIHPDALRKMRSRGAVTPRAIEPHRLATLVLEDVRRYPGSRLGQIHARVGLATPRHRIKACLAALCRASGLRMEGDRRSACYWPLT